MLEGLSYMLYGIILYIYVPRFILYISTLSFIRKYTGWCGTSTPVLMSRLIPIYSCTCNNVSWWRLDAEWCRPCRNIYPRKHNTLTQCYFDVGPASQTLAQHQNNIGWTCCLLGTPFRQRWIIKTPVAYIPRNPADQMSRFRVTQSESAGAAWIQTNHSHNVIASTGRSFIANVRLALDRR